MHNPNLNTALKDQGIDKPFSMCRTDIAALLNTVINSTQFIQSKLLYTPHIKNNVTVTEMKYMCANNV